jgi:hypothetical protein
VFGSASAPSGGTSNNYGVYGFATGGAAAWAGYFSGDAKVTGNLYVVGTPYNIGGTGSWNTSDEILKQNIESLSSVDALQWLNQLQPSSYYFDTLQFPQFHFPKEQQFGFIAQDVENILPNIVRKVSVTTEDSAGFIIDSISLRMLNYQEIIPILAAALQEVNSKNDDLQNQVLTLVAQVNDLQAQLDGCCGQFGMRSSGNAAPENVNNQSVELKSTHQTYLGQSVPNPYKGQCTIPYYVDESVSTAEIVFYDELGREVSRVQLIGHGNGQLTVLSSQLEDGIYTYSLVADGKVIDTKKMVKEH